MRCVRHFIAIFLIAWLSLQGWAAVAMPFCQHSVGRLGAAPLVTMENQAHHAHMAGRDHAHCQHHHDGKPTNLSGVMCNDCGECHLACSSSLIPDGVRMAVPILARVYGTTPVPSRYNFYPEQPGRPPLTAIA